MRLDKYLQVTGLIKRRTLANEACKLGLITINNVIAKQTKDVIVGDIINIKLAKRDVTIKVLKQITGNSLKKTLRCEYFEVISDIARNPGFEEDFWSDEEEDDE